ncbi:MAG: DUF2165 family protein [Opitutales bacterium]
MERYLDLAWGRYAKLVLLLSAAIFYFITVFNNIVDYSANLRFIQNVAGMTDTFNDTLLWRRMESDFMHWLLYVVIIGWELLAGVLCVYAGYLCWKYRNEGAALFKRARTAGMIAHLFGLMLWYFAFIIVGGQWFLMWQSENWNGQDAAFRMIGITGLILLFHGLYPDDFKEEASAE